MDRQQAGPLYDACKCCTVYMAGLHLVAAVLAAATLLLSSSAAAGLCLACIPLPAAGLPAGVQQYIPST